MQDTPSQLSTILQILEAIQANDIVTLDVRSQTTVTDFMIICSGRSSRHVKSVAQHLLEQMKAINKPALSASGLDNSDWALVDFGDFVVHIMQPQARAFYNIEGLWQNPV